MDSKTFVTQLHATDLDSGDNGQVFYEITNPGDIDGHFTIEPARTGMVLTNKILDVEIRQEYRVLVSEYM